MQNSKKLKGILFINQTLSMGGAENFNTQLLAWFRKKGVPVRAWTTYDRLNRSLRLCGIPAKKIPIVVDIIGDWKGLIKGVFLFPFAAIYYARLTYENRKEGTILLSGFTEKILVTPWAKLFNVPIVWTEHGPLKSVLPKFLGIPGFFYRKVAGLPNFVVEPSNYVALQNRGLGIVQNRVRVIGSGINPLKSFSLKPKGRTAFCVSRMERGKGQDLLIAAWPKVLQKFPDVKLYFIGEGDFLPKLKKEVVDLGLTHSVKFLGWVNDLSKAISPLFLGVFPSVWKLEGFGVVLLEAMSARKPIVCFNHGPYPEIVNSDCAIIVEKGNVDKFSDAIIHIFSYPGLAKKLGVSGEKRFDELFTMDKVGRGYYETLLQAQTVRQKGNTDSRWQTYIYDLNNKGLVRFISDRLKKHRLTRKIYYLFRKPYVMLGKNKIYINKMDTVVSEMLMNKGVWEPFVTEIFKRYLKRSKLVLDVGANIGYYTLIAAREMKSKGKVISFEPATSNIKLIEKNVRENGFTNVLIEKKAVGVKKGRNYIYLNSHNYGDNRTYKPGGRWVREKIETVALDDYFSKTKDLIDLLKIDIQGSELAAMLGARKLLKNKRIKVIISELWPEGLRECGDAWEKYVKYLKFNGFDLFQIDDEEKRLIPFSEKDVMEGFKEDKKYETNILAILK